MRLSPPILGIPSGSQNSGGPSIGGTPTAATIGTSYTWVPFTSGLVGTLTFAQTAGSAPDGTTFSTTTGGFPGTPITNQTVSGISIQVTDSASPTPNVLTLSGLSIVVSDALVATGSPTTTIALNTAYSFTPGHTGGQGTVTWGLANKPSWMAFVSATGASTGTTPGSGETDAGVTWTATDADGRTATIGPATILVGAPGPVAGDLIGASVDATGWILELTLKGFKVGGNVGLGKNGSGAYAGGSNTVQYDLSPFSSPKVSVNVTSRSGFDPTAGAPTSSLTGTSVGTISLRNPYSAGGAEQTNSETTSGSDVIIRHALSSRIAPGEVLTVDLAAGVYTDNGAGGSSAASRAATAFAVTNNSAAAHQKPICAYLSPPRQFLTTDFDFEMSCAHTAGKLGRQVAAVTMTWTGATSGVTVSKTITAMTLSTFLRSDMPRVCVFKGTLLTAEIATFTQGEQINWSFVAKPFYGPAFDSLVDGATFPTPNVAKSLPFICNKTGGQFAYATVDPTGVLTTATTGCSLSNTEQTLSANQYADVNRAVNALFTSMGRSECSGGVIYLRAGTYTAFGGTDSLPKAKGVGWLTIMPAPSTTRAGVTLSTSAGQSITSANRRIGGHVHFYNLTITTAATSTANDNVIYQGTDTTSAFGQNLWFDNCIITSQVTGVTASPQFGQASGLYATNNTITGATTPGATMDSSKGKGWWLIAGNDLTRIGSGLGVVGPLVGNKCGPGVCFASQSTALTTIIQPDQVFTMSNTLAETLVPFSPGWQVSYPNGVAHIQNIIESNQPSTQQSAAVWSGDGDVVPLPNAVFDYNTIVGERTNGPYNSTGGVAIAKRASFHYNIFYQNFRKRDTYSDPAINPGTGLAWGQQAGRVGNWSVSHAVDQRGNVTLAPQFSWTKAAPNSESGDFWAGKLIATVPFSHNSSGHHSTDDPGGLGDGTGDGGDYTHYKLVGPANDAWDQVPAGLEKLPFDIIGTARDGAAGAFAKAS